MNALIVIAVGYALGCFSTAYYLFRISTGGDIRGRGSGNAGARNIGRELGALAFGVTLAVDSGKGFLAVALARHFESDAASPLLTLLAMLAVVAGHIWPAQLGFRGGKGVAAGIGALAAFDAKLLIPSAVVFAIAAPLAKSFTLGGLLGIAATPIAAAIFHQSALATASVSILTALIIFAHREDLREIRIAAHAGSAKTIDPKVARRQP
ncbi:MAG: glycerol-3-phosphate acyltransferase [Candidatus Binatia bacterium]